MNELRFFEELSGDAQKKAAKFLESKVGYQLIGNPYVTDVAEEVEDFLKSEQKDYYFNSNGAFVCAQPKW